MEGTEKVFFLASNPFFRNSWKSCMSNDAFHSHTTFSYIKGNNSTICFIQAVFVFHGHGLHLL